MCTVNVNMKKGGGDDTVRVERKIQVKQHPNYKDNSPCLHNCNTNYLHKTSTNNDITDL